MTTLEALYHPTIRSRGNAPRNMGDLAGATLVETAHNPMCGDIVTLLLLVKDGVLVDARFKAVACVICKASADLLADAVRGCATTTALARADALRAALAGEPHEDLGDLEALVGVRAVPSRLGCVSLPWDALRAAVEQ